MITLIVYQEDREQFRYPMREKLINLGRSAQCDLVLQDSSVSALHASIIRKQDEYQLVDLDSTNGTYLNGVRVAKNALKADDVIGVGTFLLKFVIGHTSEKTEVTQVRKDFFQESHKILSTIRERQIPALRGTQAGAEEQSALEKSLASLDQSVTEAQKGHDQLKTLYHLSEVVNSTRGSEDVLTIILAEALKATGLERGAILLFDGNEALKPIVQSGMGPEGLDRKTLSSTAIDKVIREHEIILIRDAGGHQDFVDSATVVAQRISAIVGLPLVNRYQKCVGVLYADSRGAGPHPDYIQKEFLRMFSLFAASAIETRQAIDKERTLTEQLAAAREREKYAKKLESLEKENKRLAKKAEAGRAGEVVGMSAAIQKVTAQAEKVAASDIPLLITGETGTGKSMIARMIHDWSERKEQEFITIDCASIPSELLESELFGHERGAFTGAVAQKKGKIELADKGTLFLDEIGDLSISLQAKLLRVLQEKRFERVGGTATLSVDVRLVTATNKDLRREIEQKRFREDLYYRICGVTLYMPPLRSRGADAVVLANAFLSEIVKQNNLPVKGFTPEAREMIVRYPWEGNIRQLRNVVQSAAVLCDGEFIEAKDLGLQKAALPEFNATNLEAAHEEVDRKLITYQLIANQYHLSNTAAALGTDRGTLRRLMTKYGMEGKRKLNGNGGEE